MYTEEEINLITLSATAELTHKNCVTLLNGLATAQPDFEIHKNYLIKMLSDGVYNKVKGNFYSQSYRSAILKKLADRGIACVTYFSKDYPENLKNTPCPPLTLFCKGNVGLLKRKSLSIVGSRRTLPNILKESKAVSAELCKKFTIVTGTADGADAAVINGALGSGNIICVLAYGFDSYYPSVNENLIKSVEKNGLLITEYTPQVKPQKFNFPARNRIIAGLSEGTLVVSAGKRSGATITARYALEYGKRVFAFPYSLGVASGEGCNSLIRDGATLVTDAGDILEDFGIEREESKAPALTAEELETLTVIKEMGDAFLSTVATKLGKMPFQLIPVITSLEMKGLIARLGGNRYAAL